MSEIDLTNDSESADPNDSNKLPVESSFAMPLEPTLESDASAEPAIESPAEPPEASPDASADEQASVAASRAVSLTDLSLAQALGQLLSRPAQTFNALNLILGQTSQPTRAVNAGSGSVSSSGAETLTRAETVTRADLPSRFEVLPGRASILRSSLSAIPVDPAVLRPLGAMLGALLLALVGGLWMLHNGAYRTTGDATLGGILMIVGLIVFGVAILRTPIFPRLPALEQRTGTRITNLDDFLGRYGLRVALVGVSLIFSAGAWLFNTQNSFTFTGVFCWLFSILGWTVIFSPDILPTNLIPRIVSWLIHLPGRIVTFRLSLTLIALVVILMAGAYLRFTDLSAYPPDMTSDHVEKALDAQRIADGARPVFMPNNGGREIVQFYTLAIMHTVSGLPINFDLLKVLTGIEGLLGILAAWWLGRELVGEENPALGNLTGLLMAGLLALSYWQLMLSRLGLRIILTPLVVSVLLVYFMRALRYNRRLDFVKSGLVLGIGLYCYQAIRIVPIFLVIGLLLALILRARSWSVLRSYIFNFSALTIVALAVFIPLGHFWNQYPDSFWARTSGRLFGDDTVEVKDPVTGSVVIQVLNTQDHLTALKTNIGYLGSNMRRALLMFNFQGDSSWITGAPNGAPEMDLLTGALFVIGLGAWLIRMVRRRDPADWLIPFALVVMLLPTALSLAFTVEVPSATRASGALPFAYALAAFAGALILTKAWDAFKGRLPRVGLTAALAVTALLIGSANANTYFNSAMVAYRHLTLPHRTAGQVLKGFEESTGAPGNAFMIGYDYWMDHRALAIEADDIHWNNGIIRQNYTERIVQAIKNNVGSRYEFQADRQVLFFLNQNDTEVLNGLKAWLPNAITERVSAFDPAQDFILLVAPPPGCDWLTQNVGAGVSAVCDPPPAPAAQ